MERVTVKLTLGCALVAALLVAVSVRLVTPASYDPGWPYIAAVALSGTLALAGAWWVRRRDGAWHQMVAEARHLAAQRLERLQEVEAKRHTLTSELQRLRSESALLRRVLDASPDAVLITDAFHHLIYANRAAHDLFRLTEQALKQPLEQAVDDARLVRLMRDARVGGDLSLRGRIDHEREDPAHPGQPRLFELSLIPVDDQPGRVGDGAPAGVIALLADVTDRRAAEGQRSAFVSAVSHELRTPLSSIKAYVEMLLDGEATDVSEQHAFYHVIASETHRLQRLIDNILNISRMESGVVRVHREPVTLPGLIRGVLEVIEPQARASGLELVSHAQGPSVSVYGDRDMLHQAVLNLLGNAVKYTPRGGRVEVSLRVSADQRSVTLEVADTGVGIPRADLPRIFDKFYRVQGHAKIAKGTGLGLNLVRQVMETVHGGRVTVESEVGVGSRFCCTLPVAAIAASSAQPQEVYA